MKNALLEAQSLVDRALNEVIDGLDAGVPARLREAMRYAALSPGKRLRPALVFGSARALGARPKKVVTPACAVEMVHAYSLVHDDLPALDDDDLRRGRPTLHRAFDEATALLAGDALLTEAWVLLAKKDRSKARPRDRLRAVLELSRAAGAAGMVGGQQDDIMLGEGPELEALRAIHRRKTGCLIEASCALGAIWLGAGEEEVEALRSFGRDIGLAFQLVDDALDGDGIARIAGEAAARAEAESLTTRALKTIEHFGKGANALSGIARMIVERRT